ncbi:MAG: hypothetical protein IJ599_03035 [Alphaproteobacteria bacterium]|nr:hypothetical protein [Alphaproteobacteria bacterium]
MLDNFRKKKSQDTRQRYLRYGDVFMSGGGSKQRNQPPRPSFSPRRDEQFLQHDESLFEEQYDYEADADVLDEPSVRKPILREPEYFSDRDSIINEKMLRYQKRKLPPLQRYSPNSHRDQYAEFNRAYWDEEDRRPQRQGGSALGALWQKFLLTFAAILSLVCLSWIAYNWSSGKSRVSTNSDGIPIIEPEQPYFKVLPENPGGAEIAYRDKAVYGLLDGETSAAKAEEDLSMSQEEVAPLPEQRGVEEYSIVDDKVYYIKISAGKDKQVLLNEAQLLKKRHAALFDGKVCSVKKVSNAAGEQKHAILIGPFDTQDAAINTARNIGDRCYVISVRE